MNSRMRADPTFAAVGVALLLCVLQLAGSVGLGQAPIAHASEPFHKCRAFKGQLERDGIFHLATKHASCKLGRQVAYQERRGVDFPKGFTCEEKASHIDSIRIVCERGIKRVLVVVEG